MIIISLRKINSHRSLTNTKTRSSLRRTGSTRIGAPIFFALWCLILTLVLPASYGWAAPATAEQAEQVVAGWLNSSPQPLGTTYNQLITRIEAYPDNNQPLYYIVYIQPAGFVVVAADDRLEPIIAMVEYGIYDPSWQNPLGALISQDLADRLVLVNNVTPGSDLSRQVALAQDKWLQLTTLAGILAGPVDDPAGVYGVRVEPRIQTKWGQGVVCGWNCYNYYTPNDYQSPYNFISGCVATAMAQLMKFHEYPVNGIGVHTYDITVEGSAQSMADSRGGDGLGGPYLWYQMPLTPDCSLTTKQREAIGALCYDAGIAVHMNYGHDASGAYMSDARDALENTFQYSQAILGGSNIWQNIGPGLYGMINPNLDAGLPVLLGVDNGSAGHALVCDGYGYDSSTLYHHLNMGWEGHFDAWYNLPEIDTDPCDTQTPYYNAIHACIYNIFTDGTGEIISGRVTSESGRGLYNATVTARIGQDVYTTNTNTKGIYAFTNIPSNTPVIVSATYNSSSYLFEDQIVWTGKSQDGEIISGNRGGIDFVDTSSVSIASPKITSLIPASGPPGTYMKIEGENFKIYPREVLINHDLTAEIIQWTDTEIYCVIPDGAESGEIEVVTYKYQTSEGVEFEVTDPISLVVDKENDSGIENGSEAYPFSNIQRGINIANQGDVLVIKEGIYTGKGNNDLDFLGKIITVRSENGNPDNCIIDCRADVSDPNRGFIFQNAEDPNAVIEGITIQNGYAENGGAILCNGSSPSIIHCKITSNRAAGKGGGIYANLSNPCIQDCIISDNDASGNGGGIYACYGTVSISNSSVSDNTAAENGGGIYGTDAYFNITNSMINGNNASENGGGFYAYYCTPFINNCRISQNTTFGNGGGIYDVKSDSTLRNSIISGNTAWEDGGALYCYNSVAHITNSILSGNTALQAGGAVTCNSFSNAKINNCTIVGNQSADNAGAILSLISQPLLTNCILWDNHPDSIQAESIKVTFSNIEGDWNGQGNLNQSPMFNNPGSWQTGGLPVDPNYDLWIEGDYQIDWNSPCVNAGANTVNTGETDILGNDRIVNEHVDMGAYENQVELFDLNVVVAGDGIVIPARGAYPSGTLVELTAVPAAEVRLKKWTNTQDDTSLALTNDVLMDSDKTVGAQFEQIIHQVTLDYDLNGGEGVIPATSGTYELNTIVPLSVTPDPGYRVKAWHGTDNDNSLALSNSVTLDQNKAVIVELAADMSLTECTVKAGKYAGQDSIQVAGFFPAGKEQIVDGKYLSATIRSEFGALFEESVNFGLGRIRKGVFKYKGKPGALTSFMFDLNNQTFSLEAKNIDLTGLSSPVFVDIQLGDFSGTAQADEDIINGPLQPLPMQLLAGAANALRIDDVIVQTEGLEWKTTDTLTISGAIAVQNSNINFYWQKVTIQWSEQTYTIPQFQFTPNKNDKYTCKKVPLLEGGLATVNFDLLKGTFNIEISQVKLNPTMGPIEFTLSFENYNATLNFELY
ncbi:MAG: C10 family peptidase [Sedimentisphaerales bacterium]|nr:C10 family peptidase [Sedimentisphaerales bacterium]